MSGKISAKTILENNILCLPVLSLPEYYPIRRQGLQCRFSPKMIPESYRKSIYPSATAKGTVFMPRMSKKRKLEWQFFLNYRNRMTYNPLCRKCAYGCKQSFRAVVMDCPCYHSKRTSRRKES